MHVGFLTLESPYDASGGGGIAAYLRAIIPALQTAGHRVTVVANTRNAAGEFERDGVRVLNIRLPSLHWYCSRLPLIGRTLSLPLRQYEWARGFAQSVTSLSHRDRVDVWESTELGALFLAGRSPTPVVVRSHGSDSVFRKYTGQRMDLGARWNHRLERVVRQRARALTSPSLFQAREVAAEMGWPIDQVRVIPNPIAPEILSEALRHEPDRSADLNESVVLYTGRLAPVKGTVPLLEAIPLIRRVAPQAQVILAGPWQMSESPERFGLLKGGAENREGVKWLGHVPWHDLAGLYRRAAVFVMPSYYETFGISCLEAMAFGLPVVATWAGGLPEVVEDGVTGLLVPPGDPAALAGAVGRLLADPGLRLRLGQSGRERVLANFTAERVVRETVPVYQHAAT